MLPQNWLGQRMQFDRLKRREFITLVGGTAATWSCAARAPCAARAQEPGKIRRIGVLIALAQSDPEAKAWVSGFLQGLNKRGWSEDRNLQVEYRFAPSTGQAQALAKELLSLRPEVIFAMPTPAVAALRRETHEIPIVFAALADPIGSGFIASLPRPGGNMTGVMQYEPSVTGKWLSMLKDVYAARIYTCDSQPTGTAQETQQTQEKVFHDITVKLVLATRGPRPRIDHRLALSSCSMRVSRFQSP
jgi:putative tryptophan/tyrosine transport system substrate-binding protein